MFDLFPLVRPLLHRLDPETAHDLTIRALAAGLVPTPEASADPVLRTRLFGRELATPLGLAAGFDKQARVFARMLALGFSFTEVGGITPRPQVGNPRPRLFRLGADRAVINRMGFNNVGLEVARARLVAGGRQIGPLGVNLASNADSADPAADFVALVAGFAPVADYLVVNVSCPNTANGKVFQDADRLRPLLARLIEARAQAVGDRAVPGLWLKIAPDLTVAELEGICAAALEAPVEGMVVSNTTIARPDTVVDAQKTERGGLSGRPLFAPSTAVLAQVRRLTQGRLPLIGVGGIEDGATAYAKIRAGASGLQLYTALVYQGPAVIGRIGRELAQLLRRDGHAQIADAVGADVPVSGPSRQAA